MTQRDLAAAFQRLHPPVADDLLVLPNAWDAMSARVIETAGARAIATTSSGVSWALGRRDGEGLTREEMASAVRRIVAAVGIPVTADIEAGYGGDTPEDVAETVRAILDAGAVGINLEDGPGRGGEPLVPVEEQAERLVAARSAAEGAGVDLFINARTDVYLREVGDAGGRLAEVLRRARVYRGAGADGIFVPGVVDGPTIGRLVAGAGAPLNVLTGRAGPTIPELRELGVARVSVGPSIALAVMAQIRTLAGELLGAGSYKGFRGAMSYDEADGLFAPTGTTARR
ncbi:MAG: isocitrate lyase/PEP mutase family protein [Gemmatimonadales bacterium]